MRWLAQFSRFSVVGFLNTGVDLGFLNAATLLTGVKHGGGYAAQKGLSFSLAALCSYLLNKRWTFGDSSREERKRKFAQFLLISVLGALINVPTATAVVTYGKPLLNTFLSLGALSDQLWVNIGALCGTAAGFMWNFLGYKLLVFKA